MSADVRTLPRLKSHEHSKEPLWAKDTGRNSNSGKYSGTFIGYFSQVVLEFGKTTQEEMNIIKSQLEHPVVNLIYKSSDDGEFKAEDFYGTKISGKHEGSFKKKYSPFSVTLTAIEECEE